MPAVRDAGSFRDPAGEVYLSGGRVFRSVNAVASQQYENVRDSGILAYSVEAGFLVDSRELPRDDWPEELAGASYVLEHPKIPFISYPYEWSFRQLKAAALLHLDFQLALLERGAILTDASAYNVQFRGAKPVFIDLLSVAPYQPGQYWGSHRQFCEQFLNPLLLRSKKGVAHNPWYRGALDGISTIDLASLLSFRNKLSWRMFTQVVLHARMDRSALRNPKQSVKRVQSGRSFPLSAYRGFLMQLRSWIASLTPRAGTDTIWQSYATDNTYADDEATEKRRVIQSFVSRHRPGRLIDLGCNTGDYSIAALEAGAGYVVGFDFDFNAIDEAFDRAVSRDLDFLPLLLDAVNPSPDQGWMQRERAGFGSRAKANAVVALAFEHHLAIAKNVPLAQVVEWIVDMAPVGIIEFVPKSDETVMQMLALRGDVFPDYTQEKFEEALGSRAEITRKTAVSGSGRTLYEYARPRQGTG